MRRVRLTWAGTSNLKQGNFLSSAHLPVGSDFIGVVHNVSNSLMGMNSPSTREP